MSDDVSAMKGATPMRQLVFIGTLAVLLGVTNAVPASAQRSVDANFAHTTPTLVAGEADNVPDSNFVLGFVADSFGLFFRCTQSRAGAGGLGPPFHLILMVNERIPPTGRIEQELAYRVNVRPDGEPLRAAIAFGDTFRVHNVPFTKLSVPLDSAEYSGMIPLPDSLPPYAFPNPPLAQRWPSWIARVANGGTYRLFVTDRFAKQVVFRFIFPENSQDAVANWRDRCLHAFGH